MLLAIATGKADLILSFGFLPVDNIVYLIQSGVILVDCSLIPKHIQVYETLPVS